MNSGPTLSIGSTGPDVRRLQIIFVMTKELDVTDIDGNFGPKTQDAVKSFQQGNNLTPDGVVGPLTWQALPADPNTPRLARGSTGPAVSALQKGLKSFDAPNTPTDPGPIDGNFGQRTEAAVKAFQTSKGMTADGIMNAKSWSTLIIQVKKGSAGDAVRAVQEEFQFRAGEPGQGLKVDGVFGPQTDSTVRGFQHALSLD